jgi:CRISPR/Cas system-associated exonuclease Cas4 (RecB family)
MLEEETSTRSWASMLRISKSQIQTYLICPRKFWFQYVIGEMPEFLPASLPFGSALHGAVATFYRSIKETGTKPELEWITREFEEEWKKAVAGQRLSFKRQTSAESHLDMGKAMLGKFHEEVRPRKVEAVEYPFAIALSDPNTGQPLDVSLVGIIDLIESDDEGNLIIAELKTSAKRYADSQGETQLDGLIYAYAMNQLGFRTTVSETLIRYDVLVKTKKPAFQQIYFNKSPQDYGRLVRWIQEVLRAIDRESFFPNFGWACQSCQFRRRCWSM